MYSASSGGGTGPIWAMVACSSIAILLVLAFIVGRRIVRSRYFRRRDRCALEVRQNWERIVSGEILPSQWLFSPLRQELVEEIALERRDGASGEEARKLDAFFRASGLLDRHLHMAARGHGWQKRQAIQALGRMRAHEALPLVVQALDDSCQDSVLDAVRALANVGTPAAGAALVRRLGRLPALPLGIAEPVLLNCYRDDGAALLRATLEAGDELRPILARVLAEVPPAECSGDLAGALPILAADSNAEVRASVARTLAVARPPGAAGLLCELARDPVWFVRLRSMVALGALRDPYVLPALIEGLCDRNRLVRLRAASALASLGGKQDLVLRLVERTGDRYALQSLVGALDRAGKLRPMLDGLEDAGAQGEQQIVALLRGGAARVLVEATRTHPQERVRRRLRDILTRCEDPAVASYLEQAQAAPPLSPESAPNAGSGPREEVSPPS